MAAFEWATLFKLRVSSRNGSVHLGHSFEFRGYAALLIPKDKWLAQRTHHYGHLKLTQDPKDYIARIKEQLQERLKEFAAAVAAGDLRIDKDGIHFEHKPAEAEELRVSELRRARPGPDFRGDPSSRQQIAFQLAAAQARAPTTAASCCWCTPRCSIWARRCRPPRSPAWCQGSMLTPCAR